jgi:excisionase family DNA binding protein
MAQIRNGNEVVTPSKADTAIAKESSEKLSAYLKSPKGVRLQVSTGRKSEVVVLPPSALQVLVRILAEMGQGNAITLTPIRAELTSQQAADLLNVSRPHLVKLLDEGTIPSHKVGSHRRVQLEDVLAYKREFLAKRHAALDELQALSQELGLY